MLLTGYLTYRDLVLTDYLIYWAFGAYWLLELAGVWCLLATLLTGCLVLTGYLIYQGFGVYWPLDSPGVLSGYLIYQGFGA